MPELDAKHALPQEPAREYAQIDEEKLARAIVAEQQRVEEEKRVVAAKKKAEDNKASCIVLIVLFVVGVFFCSGGFGLFELWGSGSGRIEEEDYSGTSQFTLPEYSISGPEPYGTAGDVGAAYWIKAPNQTLDGAIQPIIAREVENRRYERVTIGGKLHVPRQLTFFVISDPNKQIGVDAADMSYEWSRETGIVRDF